MVDGNISSELFLAYNSIVSILPNFFQKFVGLFLVVLLVFFYAWFVWKFYRFIAKKNILELNLKQYTKTEYAILKGLLFIVEYIIIMPFLIFFWFSVFTVFLIFLTEELATSTLLIISATIVAVTRMAAYYKEDLAKEVAKLVPFTLLAVSLLNPNFFSVERILSHLGEIPVFFGDALTYLFIIVIFEMILRFFDFLFSLFGIEDTHTVEKE